MLKALIFDMDGTLVHSDPVHLEAFAAVLKDEGVAIDEEIYRYSHRFEAYKRVRPGVTGMWQVNGRSDTSYASRVKFDTFYVRNWSVPLDIGILFKTVSVVLKREGSH